MTSAIIARGRSDAPAHGAGGDDPSGEVAPQRDHQLAGKRHDRNAPDAALEITDPCAEPAAQLAFGLVTQPQPAELDRERTRASVARFADALVAMAVATVIGRIGQPEEAPDLAAIVERAVKRLLHQLAPAHHADAAQITQTLDPLLNRPARRRFHLGSVLGLKRDDLPLPQA